MVSTRFRSGVTLSIISAIVLAAGFTATNTIVFEEAPERPQVHVPAPPPTSPETKKVWTKGDKRPLADSADFSSLKSLAVSLSYPLYNKGRETHPAAFTGGGDNDIRLASSAYKGAKHKAHLLAVSRNSQFPPSNTRNYADCGAFISTIINTFVDSNFPGLLVWRQRAYLEQPSNGWKKISVVGDYDPASLRTGDIFVSKRSTVSDHAFMWLGNVGGFENVIAQAAYAPPGSSFAHLPALRVNEIGPKESDSQGRRYEVWRFFGE